MGREVKRPPQGCGGRGHTDVFTPTLRNRLLPASVQHKHHRPHKQKNAQTGVFFIRYIQASPLRVSHSDSAFSESSVNSSQRAVISSGVIQNTSSTSSSCMANGP